MKLIVRCLLAASVLAAALVPAQAVASADGTAPSAAAADAEREMVRHGNTAFSFLAPSTWVRLTGADELRARLHFVAHLREVLDAPPDVPPDSFGSLLSFAAFSIPEAGGYLIASLSDMAAPPQQIFDVVHIHGRGKNDWGSSLYLKVEEVLRNERFAMDGEPTLTIDVHMSRDFSIAAKYFRVPSQHYRMAGLTIMVPTDKWGDIEMLTRRIRDSIRIGISPEPAELAAQTIATGDNPAWDSVPVHRPPEFGGPQRSLAWRPGEKERTVAMTASDVIARMLIIAMAYGFIFLLTLRLVFVLIVRFGHWFVPGIDIKAYHEAAEKDPWTLGLLKSERMIMLCATVSMAFAGALLYLFMRY